MPFFQSTTKPTKANSIPTQEDITNAGLLAIHLKAQKQLPTRPDLKQWAKEFRLLRQHTNAQRVAAALAWWQNNSRGTYTPKIFSAKTFRQKFGQLEAAMDRNQPTRKPTGQFNALAVKIKADNQFYWPEHLDPNDEVAVLEVSLENCQAYLYALRDHERAQLGDKKTITQKLAGWVWGQSPPILDFVDGWWVGAHRWACSPAGQRCTSLAKLAFHPNHSYHQQRGRQMAAEYCGRAEVWDELLVALGYTRE